jgi:subtilase family serine protease
MIKLRSLPLYASLCILASASVFPALSQAQGVAPAVRIINRIDESQLVTLKGNTHPFANASHDRGRVADSLPMTDLILVLSRDTAQQAAFDAYVTSEYDQNSSNYHQWLTPDQIGEQFGPSQTDILTITNWLTGQGFTVSQITRDRMSIRFNGTAGQVQSAFHTEIHNLTVKGEAHISNMSDPQIPAALATVVIGVKALHNFFPRPQHRMGQSVQRDASSGKWIRQAPNVKASVAPDASRILLNHPAISAAQSANSLTARPQYGISVGGSSPYEVEDVDPWDFATIYNILPLWNKSTPIDGTGQTIAIAGTSDIDVGQTSGSESLNAGSGANGNNDVLTFRTDFGLPTGNAANTPIRISGNSKPLTVCTDSTGSFPYTSNPCEIDDLTENSLDVEWSASIAKNAQIILVASYPASATDDNLYDSESYIVNNLTARIMNVSYGECELSNGTAGNVQYYNLWEQAAAEGISVFVAAGDSGSAACDNGYSWAASGLTVSGLASTPWNTAVGGTDFNWCNPDTANGSAETECPAAPYWSSTPITSQGSTVAVTSALGYVPEVPWNESCANPLSLKWVQDAANVIYGIPSTGSNGVTNTEQSCNFLLDYDFSYDQGIYGLANPQYGYPYILYLLSTAGGSGGASNCVVGTAVTNNNTGEISGCTTGATSTGPTTNPDPPNNSQASLPLVNNGWPKPSWQTGVSGIPSDGVRDIPDVSFFASDGYVSSSAYLICVSEANGNAPCAYSTYSEPFYQEVGGTSVATPAMAGIMALINQKTGATQGFANPELYKLAATQTYASCSAESVTSGSTTCMFNDIDQETNALPCDAADTTPNCTASFSTLGYSDASTGLGILTGYSATTGFDLATGLGSLNVANVVNAWAAVTPGSAASIVAVTPSPTSINSTNTLSVTVTVAGASGAPKDPNGQTILPTGSVTLTASGSSYTATNALNSSGSYTFTIPANSLPGTAGGQLDTLTASYTGDVNYAVKTGTGTVTVTTTVASLTPTVTVTPASNTVNSASSLGVTVSVTGTGPVPTGTVTLSGGGYTSSAETIGTSPCTSNASCIFTIPANSLTGAAAPGQSDTLTATYSGDSNYISKSGTGSVAVTESSVTLTPGAPSPTSVTPGQSATVTVTAATTTGYAGILTLTCSEGQPSPTTGDGATCTGSGNSQINLATCSGASCSVTFTIGTYAPITAALERPTLPGNNKSPDSRELLGGAGSGAILALLAFFGIPARRRSWRSMLSILVAMIAIGTLASCGGGSTNSSGGGGGGQNDPGTTAGTYTFTITASAIPSITPTVTQTFTVTVN